MSRIGSFFLGFLIGGAVVYTSLHYHIVRADDGLHFVPKTRSTFAGTYVDIRDFGFQDWTERAELSAAITAAGKVELMRGAVTQPLNQAVDGFIDHIGNPQR